MGFHYLAISALFYLFLIGSHARDRSQNTPFPKALQNLAKPGVWIEGKTTHAKVGDKKLDVDVYNKAGGNLNDKLFQTDFFLEHDLRQGKVMSLHFTKPSDEFTFLPHEVAKSIPFSSSKYSELLNHFGIEAKSAEAETVKFTLEVCEKPGIKGEDKYCTTSLESLIDFTVSKLGKNIRVVSTELEKETQKKQQYRIAEGVQKVGGRAVVCHKLNYPYAVFYCHEVHATRAYTVPLVASDGSKAKALAVCHTDTRIWHKKNLAFEVLKVQPGTVPVCHFLATDTLLWVPN
ncbi:hypothetical protein L6164_022510 [Bauhinia variegata]|uniref:Uncharacterized protein n=1 Tax=Bauhinia variegata TaxID=167791 RepID=A0ACB9MFG5_BAUVA|nr:hypothetical protein L6164_022510 [Bauhinia variegata]